MKKQLQNRDFELPHVHSDNNLQPSKYYKLKIVPDNRLCYKGEAYFNIFLGAVFRKWNHFILKP